jgi:ubiquinone/menaquinone biosynthesis C-methylase UbiE
MRSGCATLAAMSVPNVARRAEPPAGAGIPPHAAMARLMSGYAVSQLIYAAATLGIADLLEAGAMTGTELADAVGADRDAVARVMRGLVVAGVVEADGPERFAPTPLTRLLSSDAAPSMRALAVCGEESYRAWGRILHTIETGKPAFDACFGMSRFEFLEANRDSAAAFDEAMSQMVRRIADAVVAAVDLSGRDLIVDVGGGRGLLLSAMLEARPDARGVLVDTPAVVADAESHVAASGVADRCELVGGDFFESVPPGGDAYVLSQTIHNWDDDRAVRILDNCRRAMAPGGVVLVVEMLMPEEIGTSPLDYPVVMTDLQMMVMTGGRERTQAQHERLFDAAGLSLARATQTASPAVVLEAVAAGPAKYATPEKQPGADESYR